MKTITGREIKVTTIESELRFEIETESGKFSTFEMTQEEFNSEEFNSANDWQQFLNHADYYKI